MSEAVRAERPSAWFQRGTLERLERAVTRALRRARATGSPACVSIAAPLEQPADPAAIVAASRRPGEPWFCLEQPDRDGSSLAALGCLVALEARGPDRFAEIGHRWRALAAAAVTDTRDGPPGSGLVALGGFAFARTAARRLDGAGSPPARWSCRRSRSRDGLGRRG
jgi:hypothetical protein